MHVDQLVRHRRRFGQDAEPREWIVAVVERERAGRDRWPADAVEAAAAGDEVAGECLLLAVLAIADARCRTVVIFERKNLGLEPDLPAAGEAGIDQVLHHLVLPVDGHHLAGEVRERDAMAAAAEAE